MVDIEKMQAVVLYNCVLNSCTPTPKLHRFQMSVKGATSSYYTPENTVLSAQRCPEDPGPVGSLVGPAS